MAGGGGGDLETQELSEEHFPWKILPTGMQLICCDGHLEGFRFFLNCVLQSGQLTAEENTTRRPRRGWEIERRNAPARG